MTPYRSLVQRLRVPLWTVTITYVLFASAWIYLSDESLAVLVRDPDRLIQLSVYKGLFFVVVTAALLAFLLHSLIGRVVARESEERAEHDALVREHQRVLEEKSAQLQDANQRLKAAALQLEMATRLARLGGWTLEVGSRQAVWSDEVCRIHGEPLGTAPDLEGGISYYDERSRPIIAEAVSRCLEFGTDFDLELEILSRDGRRVQVRAIGEAVRDESGKIVRLQGAFQDVSEQRRERAERRELAERLRVTLENISEAVVMFDQDWRILFINREGELIVQKTAEEIVGEELWTAFPGVQGSRFETEFRRALSENGAVRFTEHYPPLRKWYDITAYPTVEGLAIFFRDVSEQREKERRLATQAALLDKARDAILVCGLDGRILFWSQGAERLYGWPSTEALGKHTQTLLNGGLDEDPAARQELMERGEWSGTLRQVTRDGHRVIVECRLTLVRGGGEEPDSILALNTDVTERRQLEQQFLRAQRLESIGTLAGGIAHDLNNVLSPVMMSLDILHDMVGSNGAELVNGLRKSVNRGADLVRQVLSFARGLEGRKGRVDLKVVYREIEAVVRDTFPKNIRVVLELTQERCFVHCDATQLHQVMMNLVVNARDAMPRGGTLTLRMERAELSAPRAEALGLAAGEHLRLEVADDGEGIKPEHQEVIFEPFFTTKDVGRGTGLGLSTVQTIVRNHEGAIELQSELGKGSSFVCWFPLLSEDTEESSAPAAARRPPRGNGECILVVDDEPAIRNIAQRILERFGYKALSAANGVEALTVYRANREQIAAVITDVSMPEMDGPALITALRAEGAEQPIIVSSGYLQERGAGGLLNAGTEFFISKPFTAEVLLTTLRGVLVGRR